jgi:hypothetical protein
MLSVIKDRIDNADMYEREYFSKYPQYGYSRRKIGFSIDNLWELKKKKYFPGRRNTLQKSLQKTGQFEIKDEIHFCFVGSDKMWDSQNYGSGLERA